MAQTHIPSPGEMSGLQNPKKKREAELARLMDEYDARVGIKPKTPDPWHSEKGLSKSTKQSLDALEPKQKKSGGFYQESEKQKAEQDAFDQALKDIKDPGTGTWQATPPTKRQRLLAWHKSLGSPQHVIDQELAQLEAQEAKK